MDDEKDKIIERLSKELSWARDVIRRYEDRMQEMANKIRVHEIMAIARAEGREPTFQELISFQHIATERYEA